MDCKSVRDRLLDYRRGRVAPEEQARVASHVEGCGSCRRAVTAEGELEELLAHRLPRHAAPFALKRLLASRFGKLPTAITPPVRRRWLRRAAPSGLSAFAAAALVLLGMRVMNPVPHPPSAPSLVD